MRVNTEALEPVLNQLLNMIAQYTFSRGEFQTAISFLSLLKEVKPTIFEQYGLLTPSVCIVLQGNKSLTVGEKTIEYGVGDYLASCIVMPVRGRVSKASHKAPYIAIKLTFTLEEIASVVLEVGIAPKEENRLSEGVFVGRTDTGVLLALERLLRLAPDAQAVAFLAPALKREIVYHLLTGEDGGLFYTSMLMHHEASGISKAIHYVKINFDRHLTAEEIAHAGNMSVSALYHKFKAVTTLSPIQYQKQLRLQEARKILLGSDVNVTGAALQVGYGSLTQFNREYKRLFGRPPLQDIQVIREQSHE